MMTSRAELSPRFPYGLIFSLTRIETEAWNRSQNATGSQRHRDPRFPPYAFTEHGAIMAATILNSPRAVEMGNCRRAVGFFLQTKTKQYICFWSAIE
jgi:ORF6N domain